MRALHRGVAESVDTTDSKSVENYSHASSNLAVPTIISGCSSVWQSTWLGTKGSKVRILLSRPHIVHPSGFDTVNGPLNLFLVTTVMLSWVRGLNQQVANLSFISDGPQVRILCSAPFFWVDMQIG